MATDAHHLLLSSILLLSAVLYFPARSASQECPYPCYPPPTGAGSGNNPAPVTSTPPSPPTGVSNYPPPLITTPSGGNLPYNPPPGLVNGLTPPPPEPILPWFPFYYRKPLHADQPSSTALQGSSRNTLITALLVFISFFFFN